MVKFIKSQEKCDKKVFQNHDDSNFIKRSNR